MTLCKVRSLFDQSVEVGGLHKWITQASNSVITLLISDYENDVWLLRSHHWPLFSVWFEELSILKFGNFNLSVVLELINI